MARDYAKYNPKKRKSDNKYWHPDVFIIITLLVVISVTSCWIYTHKLRGAFAQNSKLTRAIDNLQAFFQHKQSTKNSIRAVHDPVLAQQEEVRFDFYNELPKLQVKKSKVVPLKVQAATQMAFAVDKNNTVIEKVNPTKGKSGYRVQLGHFKEMNTASEMRISLLLMGIDAEIVKKGEEFCLQHGSYTTLTQAKEAQKKLQQKGFESDVQNV